MPHVSAYVTWELATAFRNACAAAGRKQEDALREYLKAELDSYDATPDAKRPPATETGPAQAMARVPKELRLQYDRVTTESGVRKGVWVRRAMLRAAKNKARPLGGA